MQGADEGRLKALSKQSVKGILLDLDDTRIDTRTGTRQAMADYHHSHGHLMGVSLETAWMRFCWSGLVGFLELIIFI